MLIVRIEFRCEVPSMSEEGMTNCAFVLEANLIFVDVKYTSSLLLLLLLKSYWADASESSLALDCRN